MTVAAAWPALVLAAGLGTRLRPLSAVRAKAALPVAGEPLIVRILSQLRAAGVARVVINLHHRAGDHHAARRRRHGLGPRGPLLVGDRGPGLGRRPGARPAPARRRSLPHRQRRHAERRVVPSAWPRPHASRRAPTSTLAVAPADLSKYNALLADGSGAFTGFAPRGDRSPAHRRATPGISSASRPSTPRRSPGVDPDRPSDSLRDVYAHVASDATGGVRVFPTSGAFHDIGTPAGLPAAPSQASPRARSAAARSRRPDRSSPRRLAVEAPVLWDRVTVGDPGAELSHCIVTDDVDDSRRRALPSRGDHGEDGTVRYPL